MTLNIFIRKSDYIVLRRLLPRHRRDKPIDGDLRDSDKGLVLTLFLALRKKSPWLFTRDAEDIDEDVIPPPPPPPPPPLWNPFPPETTPPFEPER